MALAIIDPLERALKACTRHGIFGTAAARNEGVLVDSELGTKALLPAEIAQIIDDLDRDPKVNYPRLLRDLAVAPVPSLDLNAKQLLKVRATLLFATAEAKDWSEDTNLRKRAIARTYRRTSRPGFYEQLDSSMRDDIVKDFADVLRGAVRVLSPSALKPSHSDVDLPDEHPRPEDPYVTEAFDGRRIEPGADHLLRDSHRRTIRALRDGVDEFRQNMTFVWTGASLPRNEIVGLGEMSIENPRSLIWSGVQGYQYELVVRFPPLSKGETREIAWDAISEVDDSYFKQDSKFKIFGVGPRGIWEQARVTVRFSSDRIPNEIWKLTATPRDSVEIEIPGGATPIEVESGTFGVTDEWVDLRPAHVYGFRWRWRAPDPE